MSDFKVEKDGGVWTFTIDRPERRNALTWSIRDGLLQTVTEAERDGGVGALVVTGTGDKAFCAGGDVEKFSAELDSFDEHWPGPAMEGVRRVGEIGRRLIMSPIVVITALNGAAFGGGTFLALSGDIVVAHRRAKLGFGFAKRGLVPDWGGFFLLPRLVGLAQAKSLVLRGTTLTAEEAWRMGMIAELTDGDPVAEAQAIGREMADGPRTALGMAKQVLGRAYETSLEGMLTYEVLSQTLARRTADHVEGVRSFLEKRPPRFQGR